MVIQRWQSVFLLLAAVFIVVFTFTPVATLAGAADLKPKHFPVWMVLNLLIAVLLFIAIFMYKSLAQQRRVTLVSMVLLAASALTGGFTLYGPQAPEGSVELVWAGGIILLIGALAFALAAYRGINADHRKLASYDRLR